MNGWLNDPMVQSGAASSLVAVLVAGALWPTKRAWWAIVAAYLTTVVLTTGLTFEPWTAGRRVTALILATPLIGAALDLATVRSRWLPWAVAVLGGATSWWAFAALLVQREGAERAGTAVGVAVFVALHTALTLRLRDDGVGGAAAGVASGLGVGVAAFLSASIGYLMSGIAVAAGAGALMLIQFGANRAVPPGYAGMLPIGLGLALLASATAMTAQLPCAALPLLCLVPWAARLPLLPSSAPRLRLMAVTGAALAAAMVPVATAWIAARAQSSVVN
jgi:hypothetical protein